MKRSSFLAAIFGLPAAFAGGAIRRPAPSLKGLAAPIPGKLAPTTVHAASIVAEKIASVPVCTSTGPIVTHFENGVLIGIERNDGEVKK